MDITIFTDLTTNEHLDQLKVESEKYTGLYVDMHNAPERKYVKDKADGINQLIKKIERKRIDAVKAYKIDVDKEAASITEDLRIANLPFDLLIDEYKAERAKILADKKELDDYKEALAQKELDHEMGLLINKTYEFDRAEEKRLLDEAMEQTKKNVMADLEKRHQAHIAQEEQDKINAENARLADVEHVRGINNGILEALLTKTTLPVEQVKLIVRAIARNEIPNLTINY